MVSDHYFLLLQLQICFVLGNKKEKQGSEILTMLLQALKNTVTSNSLPVQKILVSWVGLSCFSKSHFFLMV